MRGLQKTGFVSRETFLYLMGLPGEEAEGEFQVESLARKEGVRSGHSALRRCSLRDREIFRAVQKSCGLRLRRLYGLSFGGRVNYLEFVDRQGLLQKGGSRGSECSPFVNDKSRAVSGLLCRVTRHCEELRVVEDSWSAPFASEETLAKTQQGSATGAKADVSRSLSYRRTTSLKSAFRGLTRSLSCREAFAEIIGEEAAPEQTTHQTPQLLLALEAEETSLSADRVVEFLRQEVKTCRLCVGRRELWLPSSCICVFDFFAGPLRKRGAGRRGGIFSRSSFSSD